MRIFYASDSTPNSSFKSNLWKNNLYLTLIDLSHEVIEFDYDLSETFRNLNPVDPIQRKFIKKNRPKVSQELLRQIKKAHEEKPIDLFFSYFFDACVLPETIYEIKSLGIKTVNWYCNGSYQLDLVSEISPLYKLAWSRTMRIHRGSPGQRRTPAPENGVQTSHYDIQSPPSKDAPFTRRR